MRLAGHRCARIVVHQRFSAITMFAIDWPATPIIRPRKQRLRIGSRNFQLRTRRTRRILAPLLSLVQGAQ